MLKTLDAFQFDAQPELNRDAILQLCGGAFVAEAATVVLVGGVGTGKTHLAIALGMGLLPARLSGPVPDGRRVDHAGRRSAAAGAAGPETRPPRPRRCRHPRRARRPHCAPCHRAYDQRGQLPPQGRPRNQTAHARQEENALMGTRQGSFSHCQKVPFLLAISSLIFDPESLSPAVGSAIWGEFLDGRTIRTNAREWQPHYAYGPSTARGGYGPTTAGHGQGRRLAGPSQGPFLTHRKQTSGGRPVFAGRREPKVNRPTACMYLLYVVLDL